MTSGVSCLMPVPVMPASGLLLARMDHCCVSLPTFEVLIWSSGEKRVLCRSTLCDAQSPDPFPCACVGAASQVPAPARPNAIAIVPNPSVAPFMTTLLAEIVSSLPINLRCEFDHACALHADRTQPRRTVSGVHGHDGVPVEDIPGSTAPVASLATPAIAPVVADWAQPVPGSVSNPTTGSTHTSPRVLIPVLLASADGSATTITKSSPRRARSSRSLLVFFFVAFVFFVARFSS